MSTYIKVDKTQNGYTVDPNATSGGGVSIHTELPCFQTTYDGYPFEFFAIDANGNFIDSIDELNNAKWWYLLNSGMGGNKACYTSSDDDYPFYDDGVNVSTYTGCTITCEDGVLTIITSDNMTLLENAELQEAPFELGKAICYYVSS